MVIDVEIPTRGTGFSGGEKVRFATPLASLCTAAWIVLPVMRGLRRQVCAGREAAQRRETRPLRT